MRACCVLVVISWSSTVYVAFMFDLDFIHFNKRSIDEVKTKYIICIIVIMFINAIVVIEIDKNLLVIHLLILEQFYMKYVRLIT